ncbi:putative 26S proteasome regulatory subunit [Rhizina undulata]
MEIHAPSVSSSHNQNANIESTGDTKADLLQLIKKKDDLEAELKALGSVLDLHKVNMNTSLTTFDGYPRDDIDVAQIRVTRSKIIHLRNDYKALMSQIEKGLHKHHAELSSSDLAPTPSAPASVPTAMQPITAPFARVNTVVPMGPADLAGLQPGDLVKRFGSVNALNHQKLSKLAEAVQASEGSPISVLLARKDPNTGVETDVTVTLTPTRTWGGRGLIGCHFLPL